MLRYIPSNLVIIVFSRCICKNNYGANFIIISTYSKNTNPLWLQNAQIVLLCPIFSHKTKTYLTLILLLVNHKARIVMKSDNKRVCIYPKDIQRITGKSYRYSRLLLKQIKTSLNKQEHQFVSIDEFCQFTGLSVQDVLPHIAG